MPYAENDGLRLYYELQGSGETVILLNGIFMNTSSWILQSSLLKNHYRILLHDFRDQLKSDKTPEDYSIETHAHDLKAIIDFLGREKAHIVGMSYGGEVAIAFALRYPENLKSLSLVATVSEVHFELELLVNRWMNAAKSHDLDTFVKGWLADVYSHEFLLKNKDTLLPKIREAYRDFDYDAAIRLCRSFMKIVDEPLTPKLSDISVPTLVVAAEKDLVKPPKYSEIITSAIAGSEMHLIAGAGHALFLERAEQLNTILLGFLKKIS